MVFVNGLSWADFGIICMMVLVGFICGYWQGQMTKEKKEKN